MQFIARPKPNSTRRRLLAASIAFVAALTALPAQGLQSVVLLWNPSPEPEVAGYRLYYGTQSGVYENVISVNLGTSTPVSGLQEGVTYYFAVTAYDIVGTESLPSNEVSYTVPEPKLVMRSLTPGGSGSAKAFRFQSSGTYPSGWELQGSENLQTWKTITTGSNNFNIAVMVSPDHARFFRLRTDSPGQVLRTRRVTGDTFRGSFMVETDAALDQWTLETSTDLNAWNAFTSGTNSPPQISVIVSRAPAMFFRLKRY